MLTMTSRKVILAVEMTYWDSFSIGILKRCQYRWRKAVSTTFISESKIDRRMFGSGSKWEKSKRRESRESSKGGVDATVSGKRARKESSFVESS